MSALGKPLHTSPSLPSFPPPFDSPHESCSLQTRPRTPSHLTEQHFTDRMTRFLHYELEKHS
ncbi:hypothetical protein E2C01_031777 [Portunus trituberculatus]|uniref:Uncharacterized protein n=1 Tax=Portunus trituberculatus TaxID=210409 RepID=A0A5B7EUC8_PORTR|nr:hypothetical protein [Portunus trituberculatus]